MRFLAFSLVTISCLAIKADVGRSVNDGDWLFDLSKDTRVYWYDKDSLPQAYQSSGSGPVRLFKLGYNIAGNLDKTGTANNEHPWRHTGGLDNCNSVKVKRMLYVPVNKKIKLRTVHSKIEGGKRNGLKYSRIAGEYPEGTVVAEFLYEHDRLFEARARMKKKNDWKTFQYEYGNKPKGYIHVDSCVECHEDIGKHSFELDEVRDWYGTVRGLEPGGPIHWHPWQTDKVGGLGTIPKLRSDVKDIVEYE